MKPLRTDEGLMFVPDDVESVDDLAIDRQARRRKPRNTAALIAIILAATALALAPLWLVLAVKL